MRKRKKNREASGVAKKTSVAAPAASRPATLPTPRIRTTSAHLFILIALSLSLYALTLRNGFVTDDNMQILQNSFVKDPQDLSQAFRGDVWSFAHQSAAKDQGGSNYYRPLQILMYTGEYAAFGERPWAWHLVNMLLNAAAVILVYLLLLLLAESQLAFWTALLFALHPMHTEVVAWIAAMPELLCAVFLFAALIFYHRARIGSHSAWPSVLSSISFVFALLSKETALLFPFILVAYEYLYRGVPLRELKRHSRWILPPLGIVALYLLIRVDALGGFSPHLQAQRGQLTSWELLSAIPPVMARYIGKLLVPVGMNYFYFFPMTTRLGLASLASIGLLALFAAATLLLRRGQPLMAFAFTWFFLTLTPALSLNSIGDNFFAERYLYIPSLGFCIITAWVGLWLFRKSNAQSTKAVLLAMASAIFLFYIAQIERRIPVFHDNLSLYTVTVRQSPNAAIVQGGLAAALYQQGDVDHAIEHGFSAVALNPAYDSARLNLASYLSEKGRYPETVEQLQITIQHFPRYLPSWINLAKAYTLERNWKAARECYRRITELDPDQSDYFRKLMAVTEAAERTETAFATLRAQVDQNPHDLGALVRLGDAYAQIGHWKDALAVFEQASHQAPRDFVVLSKLAICLQRSGDSRSAISAFERAVAIRPGSLITQQSLASALAAAGRIPDSNAQLHHILQENSHWEHSDQVHLQLGLNYEKNGDRAAAMEHYRQALSLNPNLPLAQKRLAELSSTREQPNSNRTPR